MLIMRVATEFYDADWCGILDVDMEIGVWTPIWWYDREFGEMAQTKMKRGFKTKREALEWERTFLQQQTADLDMTFESFVALYATDMKGRIKENTWGTKEHQQPLSERHECIHRSAGQQPLENRLAQSCQTQECAPSRPGAIEQLSP